MSYYLKNNAFHVALHPERSTWDVYGQGDAQFRMQNARLSLHYRSQGKHVRALDHWNQISVGESKTVDTNQGCARQIIVDIGPDSHQLEYQINFTLPEQSPILIWKLRVSNHSKKPVSIEQIELLNLGFINISHGSIGSSVSQSIIKAQNTNKGVIDLSISTGQRELAFFSNGWQSWSYSGVYQPSDRYQTTRLGVIRRAMIENPSTGRPNHNRMFRSDMFGILGDVQSRTGVLVGFLSQRNHFGSLEVFLDPYNPALRMWASGDGVQLDPGDKISTDWACIYPFNLDAPDPLGPYIEAVARENGISSLQEISSPSGWCSWYYYSSDFTGTITPEAIQQNTLAAENLHSDLPLNIIQIDDGFEKNIGDWFTCKPDFPQGLAPLSADIQKAGMTAGLWLAPFIVHPKSELYHQHPDWLLRNRLHQPVNAGFCWNAFTTALDLTHPDALEYCKQVIQRAVHEWGYHYLKLDFLYAAALQGKHHDPHQSRAQVLRSSLSALRQAAGPKATLLGCGCPLGPAIGLVDYMRIGTDTARNWYPSFLGIETLFRHETSMPSARYSLHNALTRSPMHKRWWINDPDCLLVRPDSNLSLEEVQTIASVIAITGGSFFLSDDLSKLPEKRLRIAQVLLPLIDKRPDILDWFDQSTPSLVQLDLTGACGYWSLLGIFNWLDKPIDKTLLLKKTHLDPNQKYLAREFWSGRFFQIVDGRLVLNELPAHSAYLLAVRSVNSDRPIYAGSNIHISQGMEVKDWSPQDSGVSFRIDRPGKIEGIIDIVLPKSPRQVISENQNITPKLLSDDIYRLEVGITNSTFFDIQW